MATSNLHIPPGAKGERLDVAIARLAPEISRSQAGNLIRDGRVRVTTAAGEAVTRLKTGMALRGGEIIAIDRPDVTIPSAAPESIPLDIRYEDVDLLVVNKPAGMVVHPAPGHSGGTLVNALAAWTATLSAVGGPIRPGIIHRLDKNTSGLLIVAKTDRAHRALAAQLADRTLSREYCALVWGHPDPPTGRIDAPIGRNTRDGKTMTIGGRSSREAATRYRVEERYEYASWIVCTLETGRTHQIRVHLRSIGHPVVGDPDYGGRESAVRGLKPEYRYAARTLLAMLPRQALHARRVVFRHPATGDVVTVSADPPADIVAARAAASGEFSPESPAKRT